MVMRLLSSIKFSEQLDDNNILYKWWTETEVAQPSLLLSSCKNTRPNNEKYWK